MQEHTSKESDLRARSTPIHLVPASRQGSASVDALRDAHLSLVRAEQNLYNLVQASHANGQAGFGFAPTPAFAAGYAAPAFPPGFSPPSAIGTPATGVYGFPGASPWPQTTSPTMAPWSTLTPGIAALPGPLPAGPGLSAGYPAPYLALASRTPACDIMDEGKQFVCIVDLPGLRAEQVEVLCFEHAIVIHGAREAEKDAPSLVQWERGTATQQRTIPLPNEVLPAGAKATLGNGILTVTLPKAHPTEGPRRIKVQG